MGYAATTRLDDAIDAARDFLTPVSTDRWLPLAVMAFFITGTAGPGALQSAGGQVSAGQGVTDPGPILQDGLPAIPDAVWLLLGALVLVFALLWLGFLVLGSVMEFVFIEAIRTDEARVRGRFRQFLGPGLRLAAFRVVLGILTILSILALAYVLLLPALAAPSIAGVLGAVALFILGTLLVAIVSAVVNGLTVEFVVPVMLVEDCGLLDGWRHLWPTLSSNRGEVVVYILLRWVVGLLVGVVAGFLVGIIATAVAVPLLLFGGLAWVGGATLSLGTLLPLVAVLLVYLLVVSAVGAVVQVPLKTYTRYFELLVLGDLEPEWDLVPETRAELDAAE